jgi:hypothetical protein
MKLYFDKDGVETTEAVHKASGNPKTTNLKDFSNGSVIIALRVLHEIDVNSDAPIEFAHKFKVVGFNLIETDFEGNKIASPYLVDDPSITKTFRDLDAATHWFRICIAENSTSIMLPDGDLVVKGNILSDDIPHVVEGSVLADEAGGW